MFNFLYFVFMKKVEYIRDSRSPIPTNEAVSKVMSANKAKNTKPELLLRKELCENDLRGYRLHPKTVPGRPDVCYISKRVAIFMHGCFWHRCPHCDYPLPKNNRKFWVEKFAKNKMRDNKKRKELRKLGWKVFTIWECELQKNVNKLINNIKNELV